MIEEDIFEDIKEPDLIPIKKKRKKQKLEGLFSASIKAQPELLGHKLQVNKLACTPVHSDYELFNKHGGVFFVEAKEKTLNKNGSGSFPFSRLTQKNALLYYNRFAPHMKSYILLFFRSHFMKNSTCFLIDIETWARFEAVIGKKSANLNDMNKFFPEKKLHFDGNTFDLSCFL